MTKAKNPSPIKFRLQQVASLGKGILDAEMFTDHKKQIPRNKFIKNIGLVRGQNTLIHCIHGSSLPVKPSSNNV